MHQDDVIRIAREAGLIDQSKYLFPFPNQIAAMDRFANTIESETLEIAAKICDQLGGEIVLNNIDEVKLAANSLADAIRKFKSQPPKKIMNNDNPGIKFNGTEGAANIFVSSDGANTHTLFIGSSRRGRSMLITADAARRGISYEEAEKDWLPTEAEKQAEADREQVEQIKHDRRTAAVREAYWISTDPESGEFDSLHDVLSNICKRDPTDEQVRRLFNMLPAEVIGEGVKLSFTDTVVGDEIHEFVRENKADVMAQVFAD
ncbi:MAG: hypothetical protein Q7K26_00585 [bacterium]|nr:hypothetical protein [bacterium]